MKNTELVGQGIFAPLNYVTFIAGVLAVMAVTAYIDTGTLKQKEYRSNGMSDISSTVAVLTPQPTEVIATTLPTALPSFAVQDISSPAPSATVKPTTIATPKPTAKPTRKPLPTPTRTVTPTPKPTRTPTPIPTINYSSPWTVAPNCPATTLACVPCTSGIYCRFEPGKTHGFNGWACQNNNPGNIRNASINMATDSKNLMIIRNGGTPACGVRYDKRGGSYFVFSSYSAGEGALKAYIKGVSKGEHSAYTGCGNCTLAFFFSKYAPADSTYAGIVGADIGEPVTQTLKYVVDHKLNAFVAAIKKREGFFTQ